MTYNLRLFIALLACVLINFACNKEEKIPSYIYVSGADLQTSLSEGSDKHQIKDIWVFSETTLIGGFELPARIPIFEYGNHNLTLMAGIVRNGIQSERGPYPMYESIVIAPGLEAGKTDTLHPVFHYADIAEFEFIEDFEAGNIFSDDLDSDPVTNIQRESGPDVFEGNKAGYIELTAEHSYIKVASSNLIPSYIRDKAAVYLEINYKNTINFNIGLKAKQSGNPIEQGKITLYPKDEWNKMYIELQQDLFAMEADDYQILIQAILPADSTSGKIWLDNLKLVWH